jgi:hypothetical protein
MSSTLIPFEGIITVVINTRFTYTNLFSVCLHTTGANVLAVIFFVPYVVRVVELYAEVREQHTKLLFYLE